MTLILSIFFSFRKMDLLPPKMAELFKSLAPFVPRASKLAQMDNTLPDGGDISAASEKQRKIDAFGKIHQNWTAASLDAFISSLPDMEPSEDAEYDTYDLGLLTVGRNYRDPYGEEMLVGKLIVDPHRIGDWVVSLLEDLRGHICNVVLPVPEAPETFSEKYVKEKVIGIVVPALRKFQGAVVAFAKKPSNVFEYEDFSNNIQSSLMGDLANRYIQRYRFTEAEDCCCRGLHLITQDSVAAGSFMGLSLAYAKCNKHVESLICAFASLRIHPEFAGKKAYHRMAVACKALNYIGLALYCTKEALLLDPSDPHIKKLDEELKEGADLETVPKTTSHFWASLLATITQFQFSFMKELKRLKDRPYEKTKDERAPLLKRKADEQFVAGQNKESITLYLKSLLAHRYSSCPRNLLSRRSLALRKLGRNGEAAADAMSAWMFGPIYSGACGDLVKACLNMFQPKAASNVLKYGLWLYPSYPQLLQLQDQVNTMSKFVFNRSNLNFKPECYWKDAEFLSAEFLAIFNVIMNGSFPHIEAEFGLKVNKHIPEFVHDMDSVKAWPTHSNVEKCKQILDIAQESARSQALRAFNIYCDQQDLMYSQTEIAGKHRIYDEEGLKWLSEGQPQVHFHPIYRFDHDTYHSFTYAPIAPKLFYAGSVHVAVEFKDLAELLVGEIKTGEGNSGPVQWHGFTSSLHAGAKTKVIVQMMLQKASVNSIFQVWFSSTWSAETTEQFRAAANALVEECSTFKHPSDTY